jgi:hypothetical protein
VVSRFFFCPFGVYLGFILFLPFISEKPRVIAIAWGFEFRILKSFIKIKKLLKKVLTNHALRGTL